MAKYPYLMKMTKKEQKIYNVECKVVGLLENLGLHYGDAVKVMQKMKLRKIKKVI
jgi:hypothetical protein